MRNRTLFALFGVCFTLFALASLPLGVTVAAFDLADRGLSFNRADGLLWSGRISGLTWRGRAIGDVAVTVSPLSLLLARLDLEVALAGPGMSGGGSITLWANSSVVVKDFTFSSDMALLPVLLPLNGAVSMVLRHADFSRAGCRSVDADMRTDALVERPAGLDWHGPLLTGAVACRDGVLVVPLTGGDRAEAVAVTLRLINDGTFNIQVDARTMDETVKSVLSSIGFIYVDGAMSLTQHGRWS